MTTITTLQLIIYLIVLVIIIWLLKLDKTIKYEKRISKYSVNSLNDNTITLFDLLYAIYKIINNELTKFLIRIKIFNKYSKKYEKYAKISKKENKKNIEFISNKILSGFTLTTINLIMNIMQNNTATIIEIFFVFILGYIIPDIYLMIKEKLRKKKIEKDLETAVIMLNNCFKSGNSIIQAIKVVSDYTKGPIKEEFEKVYIDLTYGLTLESAFNRFYERVNLEDIKYIATSLSILNSTGGNIVKVFSSIEKSFIVHRRIKEEKDALTSSSRAVFKILIVMPIILVLLITILNNDYFKVLYTTTLGVLLLSIIIILYILYIFIVKKIMNVEGV